MTPIITLTTDFGTRDSYVGSMKGVILHICPDVHLVDITHDIPPQDITATSLVIETFVPCFPPGTIHVVVVDPGVGSARLPLALITPQASFVGPDNGIFSHVWSSALARWPANQVYAVALREPRYWLPDISTTFHGRDIFSPVAAHLARGISPDDLGPRLDTIVVSDAQQQQPVWVTPTHLTGQVIYTDHFGNCVTNITTEHLARLAAIAEGAGEQQLPSLSALRVHTGTTDQARTLPPLPISTTYADVQPGDFLALVGSIQRLELAIRNGNAHEKYGIGCGTPVSVRLA